MSLLLGITRNSYRPIKLRIQNKWVLSRNISKLNHNDKENSNIPITNMENESVMQTLPTKKITTLDGYSAEFCQTFQKELIPILSKVLKTKGRKHSQT